MLLKLVVWEQPGWEELNIIEGVIVFLAHVVMGSVDGRLHTELSLFEFGTVGFKG